MSYVLNTPYTQEESNRFIVAYNANQGLRIRDGIVDFESIPSEYLDYFASQQNPIFALEPNEMMAWQEVEEEIQIEVETEVFETRTVTVKRYMPTINPNYEEEKAQKEAERIKSLKVTKRVFALALQQFGITYAQLKELIATNDQAQLEWDLCVELERSNSLLDVMAEQMGVTSEQLDYIFVEANKQNT